MSSLPNPLGQPWGKDDLILSRYFQSAALKLGQRCDEYEAEQWSHDCMKGVSRGFQTSSSGDLVSLPQDNSAIAIMVGMF